jgi:hypothetical protein
MAANNLARSRLRVVLTTTAHLAQQLKIVTMKKDFREG